MALDSIHPQYSRWLPLWKRCRDVRSGADTVKATGELALPKPGGMSDEAYSAYVKRAQVYGAFARTVDGLLGCLFRSEPSVTASDDLTEELEDVTLLGQDLTAFATQLLGELLTTGRAALMLDVLVDDTNNPRPYWKVITAEQVIAWERSQGQLQRIVWKESVVEMNEDGEYVENERLKIAALGSVDGGAFEVGGGVYVLQTYRQETITNDQGQDQQEWVLQDESTPVHNGESLDHIEMLIVDLVPSAGANPSEPPLLALSDAVIGHYQLSADLRHALHYTALPTPWVSGRGGGGDGEPLRIGSMTAWDLPQGAAVGMLEFTGPGVEAIAAEMTRAELHMAALGARLLAEPTRSAETAETSRIKSSAETSILMGMVATASAALTQMLRWHAEWTGETPDDVAVALNKEFFDTKLSPQELAALVAAWQSNAMTAHDLVWNLRHGDRIDPGRTDEDVLNDLQASRTPNPEGVRLDQ